MDRPWIGPLIVALVALVAVLATLDAADDSALLGPGPGLTLDEGFNVEVGVYLVQSVKQYGVAAVHPSSLMEIFGQPVCNPDHPPLGRMFLGLAEAAGRATLGERPGAPMYVLTYARIAPALAFAVTALLVGWMTARWHGSLAGTAAATALVLMPRAFGHAHLASLETFMGLVFCSVLLVLADRWKADQSPGWKQSLLPGVLLGLAFLTKIQAIFLPPMIVVWALWNWRGRAIFPLIVMMCVAGGVFFIGWPWLWIDPLAHLREYFARTTERQVLYCQYFGQRFADRDVPWHYSPVMFLLTLPLGLTILGAVGIPALARAHGSTIWNNPRWQLVTMGWLGPICFFALPGIALYDGIRLFLVSLPLFAVVCGYGAAALDRRLREQCSASVTRGITGLCLAAALPQMILLSPCWLSYYSESAGGLFGAAACGQEENYWGDAVNSALLAEGLRQIPEGATLDVAPVLHPLQLTFMQHQTGLRLRPDVRLRAYDDRLNSDIRYVLTFARVADSWASLNPPPPDTHVLSQTVREGVVLARILELPTSSEPHEP